MKTIIIVTLALLTSASIWYFVSKKNMTIPSTSNNPSQVIHEYGEPVLIGGIQVQYPDFSILDISQGAGPHKDYGNFVVQAKNTTISMHVHWPSKIYSTEPVEFVVMGQTYSIVQVIGPTTVLSASGNLNWIINKVDTVISPQANNLIVDESYLLGKWRGSNGQGNGEHVFQKINGKNILGGYYSLLEQSSRSPFTTDCTWSLGKDQFGRDGLTFYCEKTNEYFSYDTFTRSTAGERLYLSNSNKADQSLGTDLTLIRVNNSEK